MKRFGSHTRLSGVIGATIAVVVLLSLLVPVCRMPSCGADGCGGVVGHERSRFRSACGHVPDSGARPESSSCDETAMRHDEPAAVAVRGNDAGGAQAAAVVAALDVAERPAGVGSRPADDAAPAPAPPPDPLFGRLVI
ncbi:MAG: hypothetical protein QMD76_01215 [Anaerosomatales bacterium]|nr:hypothetical protein [Coriobacteriia bacterium]MDI6691919.1 hypothetical protein [Anaerosomatales bacterium]MDI6843067.1 hypothetical protein [Anaerosomatales bacterium]